jgi:hypothetical protein
MPSDLGGYWKDVKNKKSIKYLEFSFGHLYLDERIILKFMLKK